MIKGLDYEKLIPSKIVRDNMDLDKIDDVAVATLIENKYFKRDEKMKRRMTNIVMAVFMNTKMLTGMLSIQKRTAVLKRDRFWD